MGNRPPQQVGIDLLCQRRPEFTLKRLVAAIQPGRPMQNSRVESFNGRLRDECLNASWFLTLAEAKQEIEVWKDYNRERPHSSFGYQTPEQFARRVRPFAVKSFVSAGCSARQGNPGGRASLGLDPPPLQHPESLYDGEGVG